MWIIKKNLGKFNPVMQLFYEWLFYVGSSIIFVFCALVRWILCMVVLQVWVVGPCVVILWKTDVFYISVLFFPSGVTICVAVWPCIILHKIYWHGSAVHRFDILILKYDLSLDIFSQTALKKLIHFWCCGSPAGMARGENQNKLLWQMVIERQR